MTLIKSILIYRSSSAISGNTLQEVLTLGNDGGGLQIKNIADPTAAQDAATKNYVDNQVISVPDASETEKGIAEIATQTETNTGTDDLRFVTPLKLKNQNYLALLASPTFTGTPAAPTAAQGNDTTQLATTAFVQQELYTTFLNAT